MNKLKISIITILATLALSSCASLNPNGDGGNGGGTGGGSTSLVWDATLVQGMNTLLKQTIPVPDIPETVTYSFEVETDYEYIDIVFDTTVDYMSAYSTLLVNNGFTLEDSGTDSGYGFTTDSDGYLETIDEVATNYSYWDLTKGDLCVSLTVSTKQLIDEDYYIVAEAGNEIFAYLDEDSGGGDDDDEGDLTAWPSDEIIAIYGSDIPSFEGTSYSFFDLSDWGFGTYIYVYGVDNTCEAAYKTILEQAGWTVEFDEDYESYYSTKEGADFEIDFYYDDGALTISVFPFEEACTEWPAEVFEEYFPGYTVPAYPNILDVDYDDSEFETYGLCIYVLTDDEDPISVYTSALEEAEFVVEYDEVEEWYVAIDKNEEIAVCFYLYDEGEIDIQIFYCEEEDDDDDNPENVISFADTTQITSKKDSQVVWENGEYSFIATQGTSETVVGNGSYLSDPFRMYSGQHGLIEWGEKEVESIVITTNNTGSKADNSTFSITSGGTSVYDENSITITPDEFVTSVEFDILNVSKSAKQLFIVSIEFVLK